MIQCCNSFDDVLIVVTKFKPSTAGIKHLKCYPSSSPLAKLSFKRKKENGYILILQLYLNMLNAYTNEHTSPKMASDFSSQSCVLYSTDFIYNRKKTYTLLTVIPVVNCSFFLALSCKCKVLQMIKSITYTEQFCWSCTDRSKMPCFTAFRTQDDEACCESLLNGACHHAVCL